MRVVRAWSALSFSTIPGLGYKSIDPSFLAMAPNVVTVVAMAVFANVFANRAPWPGPSSEV